VTVCGTQHGYFSTAEETDVLRSIEDAKTDLLLVAFGAPKQDLWIREKLGSSNVRVAIGVGGLFDFFSGRIPRAPLWLREMGLEWTYRLYQEPRRLWRRYVVGNAIFLLRTMYFRIHPQAYLQ
jgi:N-acetylglucosaminyldiphosphoundecaprenol N-acetyl-beta-D-mannosaminyltransferase